jgi:hypothetical protein
MELLKSADKRAAAESELDIGKKEVELEVIRKREEFLDQEMDVTVEPAFLKLSPEGQKDAMGYLRSSGAVNENGRGQRRKVKMAMEEFVTTSKLFEPIMGREIEVKKQTAVDSFTAYQDAIAAGKPPEQIEKLKAQSDRDRETYLSTSKAYDEHLTRIKENEVKSAEARETAKTLAEKQIGLEKLRQSGQKELERLKQKHKNAEANATAGTKESEVYKLIKVSLGIKDMIATAKNPKQLAQYQATVAIAAEIMLDPERYGLPKNALAGQINSLALDQMRTMTSETPAKPKPKGKLSDYEQPKP